MIAHGTTRKNKMSDNNPQEPTIISKSQKVLQDPLPWAFTVSELTAGLRRRLGDPSLKVVHLEEDKNLHKRPSIGKIRGLKISTEGNSGENHFDLVLKESQGTTRAGTAGAGLREVSLYRNLGDQLPVRTPNLLASDPHGDWVLMDMLTDEREPEKWQTPDYLLATDQIVALHDRFWGLGEDLTVYQWLGRPLDADLHIYKQAGEAGLERLKELTPTNMLSEDKELIGILENLIENADKVAKHLLNGPTTLLHGDYWPGNVYIHNDSSLTVIDWEEISIGPGILDLANFIQSSRWWFEPLPVHDKEMIAHYRTRIEQANDHKWKQAEWDADWDHALLWLFFTKWLDLLANIPNSILTTRLPQLEGLWLNPIRKAASRHLS